MADLRNGTMNLSARYVTDDTERTDCGHRGEGGGQTERVKGDTFITTCKTEVSGRCWDNTRSSAVLCGNLEGWMGGGWEGSSRLEGKYVYLC